MFDLVRKLLFSGQFKMEMGELKLLNQDIAFFPVKLFSLIIEQNPTIIKDVYEGSKESAIIFSEEIKSRYKFKSFDLKNWLKDIIEVAGWGIMNFTSYDARKHKASIILEKSKLGKAATRKHFADHPLRGFFAGGGSISMKKNLECIEVRCIANGDKFCEFIIAEKQYLKKEYGDLFKKQLWWKNGKNNKKTGGRFKKQLDVP